MSLRPIAERARRASRVVARTPGAVRTSALLAMASALETECATILAANALDVEAGTAAGLSPAFLDRLRLDEGRVAAMARAVREIAAQDDPVGALESQRIRPNGLRVGKMRIPLGVVAVIYEARPNVTSDAAALALRAGNAVILKGGSDARQSNAAIGAVVTRALAAAGLPEGTVEVVASTDREGIAELLTFDDLIDLVIPRGGEGLIRFVAERSRIPVVKHYKGVCHVYVDGSADLEKATRIVVNGKASRPSVCNSVETVLVDREVATAAVPALCAALEGRGVVVHGCPEVMALAPRSVPATAEDWDAEYLSLDVAMKVVGGLDDAIEHIERHGTDHTEAIVTESLANAERFTREVLSSCVMVNASTRFADGGELGLGAEIGISTSRVHAYGPMGAEGLTTTRFVVLGDGQIRE
ncbi:MAG: glutamate-5-semialdehyde dehydrogenase [Myxococcales bacterium]|nr:glutamate-5-semialdehyde dehydrogenase [Myxococcales bacterium]